MLQAYSEGGKFEKEPDCVDVSEDEIPHHAGKDPQPSASIAPPPIGVSDGQSSHTPTPESSPPEGSSGINVALNGSSVRIM